MVRLKGMFCCLLAAIALGGCSSARPATVWPAPRPLGDSAPALGAVHAPGASAPGEMIAEPTGVLTLPDALAAALVRSPKLASAALDVRRQEAQVLQGGLFPNPEFGFEVEEFGGSGPRAGFHGAEITLQLSQLVELGDKRFARMNASSLDASLAGWDYETERLAVYVETTLAFIDVLSAQEQLRLAEEADLLSEQVFGVVVQRVDAGQVPPIERTRAAIERSNSTIDLENARRRLAAARIRLAATWASSTPRFDIALGMLEEVHDLPSLESIDQWISLNPDVARWATEMEQRMAVLAMERSRRVSDLTISGGVKRLEEVNDATLLIGVSAPLPLLDKNQGNILDARYAMDQARHDQQAAEVRTRAAVAESYELLAGARFEALVLINEVLPAAEESFSATREGYQRGTYGYLELLDAQRTFFETRARYSEVLSNYHRATAVLEGMIGVGLNSVNLRP